MIPHWLKIALRILGILLILFMMLALFLRKTTFKPDYVNTPTLQGQLINDTLRIGGERREFTWYKPAIVEMNTILYVFHGSTGNGPQMRKQTAYEFDKIANEKGFIVVYPSGYDNHWNDCRASADYASNLKNTDDLSFLKEIEKKIETYTETKFEHHFAAGFSNGGHFCFKLAMEAPEWIDGISAISANMPIDENLDCSKKEQFVPLFVINGTADKINPYDGGLVSVMGNDSRGTVLSTNATMNYWTSLAKTDLDTKVTMLEDNQTEDGSTIEKTVWFKDGRKIAQLYKVINGGHTIPHPKIELPKVLGITNHDVNSPVDIWTFFEEIQEKE